MDRMIPKIMKTLATITLLAAGLAAALPLVNAAETAPVTTPPAAAATPPRLHAAQAHRAAMRQRLAKRLGLSADQTAQLKANRAKTVAAVKAIRADPALAADQKKGKVRATLQAARTEMRGVLTPDQQAKLRELRLRWRA